MSRFVFSCRSLGALALVALLLGVAPPSVASPADAGVTRATLDNGLSVVVVRDPLAPVASVYEAYRVGADETPQDFPGMAHAEEHMAFRGCSGVSGDQTAAIFANLGGAGNADTQQDVTQFFETVPAADLDVALHLDAACMRRIDDSDDAWNAERPALEREVAQDLSSPTYLAFTRITAGLFAGTPYARDPLGTRDSFERTTGAALQQFAQSWYAPNNAVLVIAGDVDPVATLASVRAIYGSIPSRPLPPRPVVALQPVEAATFTLESNLPYVVVEQGYRFPGSDDPDFAAGRVLADVLGSGRGAIASLTAQGKTLQSGFQFVVNYPKASEAQAYAVAPAGTDPKPLAGTLSTLLTATATNGVSADLVDAAKRSEIVSAEFARNAIGDLASSWSTALADEGRTSPDDDVAAIRAVTLADVNRVAHRVLDPSHAIAAILVPHPSGAAMAAKGFGGGETITTPPTRPVALPDWAESLLGEVAVPPSTIAPTDETLPNGIRLIVQPEAASDTVTLVGSIEHNDVLQTPRGKDGAGNLLADLLPFGTQTLDRAGVQKALDDIGASLSAGSDFSLHVPKDGFYRGVEVLADVELHPKLSASDFATVQRQDTVALADRERGATFLVQQELRRRLLPPGDPSLRIATPATIARVSLDDVRAYHDAVFRPDMTTIVVIGNVTPAEARETVERNFGTWAATGPKPNLQLAALPPNAPSSAVVPDRTRIADAVQLVQTIAVRRSDPAYYALQLGDRVLGGDSYATRLYRDLRQQPGLVDDVGSDVSAGKTRATYAVSFDCDPRNVAKAKHLIVRDLAAMQRADVTPAELERAKALLIRRSALAESSEDAVANSLVASAQAGLSLDESHRSAAIYARLGAADVRGAFATYLRPAGFVEVVQGPAPL